MEIHVSTPEEKAAFKEHDPGAGARRSSATNVGDELVDELLAEVDAAKADLYE